MPSASYFSYNALNSSPWTSERPGHSWGHIRDQFFPAFTLSMKRSDTQIAGKRSLVLKSSLPAFFLQSIKSFTSRCQSEI
ncbi:ORF226 [White spot syndrome virus]|uniref:ORF226 n=1 Tax=White spot syndrome virus TaxID=342409 RepID=A0A2D3I636_9VIRU|nr:ORF226 [White spot syndrome virus]